MFMSTHLVAEAARRADRVGIIHAGRLVRELPGDRLGTVGGQRLVAEFRTAELGRRAAVALGWGARWPWSIPAVAAGLAPGASLDGPAVALAVGTGLVGVLGTLA